MARFKTLCTLLIVTTFAFHAFAEEEKKEGGEGGEKKAEKAAPSVPEWVEAQAKLVTLKQKVAAKEKSIEDLIHDKQNEKDPHKLHEIIEEMKKEHKELRQTAEEYEQQRNYFRYRFPEKGLRDTEKYKHVDVKSLDQMENDAGLEGHLQKSYHKVRKQYGEPEPTAAEEAKKKAINKKEDPASNITEPQVLSK